MKSALLLVVLLVAAPAFAETTCSLIASSKEIVSGQSVTWSVTSNPAGQRYFWLVSGPFGQNVVPGEGPLTPWMGTYKYTAAGSYNAYFAVVNENGTHTCESNTVTLTVNPVFVAGTNIFPRGGTFVEDQIFDLQVYSNVASGVSMNWVIVILDNKLIGVYSAPQSPLKLNFGWQESFRQSGRHEVTVIMETSLGRFVDTMDFEVISANSALPQQRPQTVCIPLPSVGPISSCTPMPLPPPPPPNGKG